jgi:hypothetical protein
LGAIRRFVMVRQEVDNGPRFAAGDGLQNAEAITLRKGYIEDDNIGRFLSYFIDGLGCAKGMAHDFRAGTLDKITQRRKHD